MKQSRSRIHASSALFRRFAAVLVILAIYAPASVVAVGVQIAVTPATIGRETNLWVDIDVTSGAGPEFLLSLHVDVNTNGTLDADDQLLAAFPVRDGVTNDLGSSVIVDDDDATVNGEIHTSIPYFGLDCILHTVGHYLWQVTDLTHTDSATTPFQVTQPQTTVWVTGQVADALTANGVPGAVVGLFPPFEHLGFHPRTFTDTNGTFVIYVPDDFGTNGVQGVMAFAPGYFAAPTDQDENLFSAYAFTGALQPSGNALTNALLLAPAIPSVLYTVSGHIYDEEMNGVPGTLVIAEQDRGEEEDGDDDMWAWAVTDTNGYYELPFPGGMDVCVLPMETFLNPRGLVGAERVETVAGDVSGVDITCPSATTLARARVTEGQSGDPVVGAQVFFETEEHAAAGYTLSDGYYEIGVIADTSTWVECDMETLVPQGYVCEDNEYEGFDVPGSGLFTDAVFEVSAGCIVSGRVYDDQTNGLPWGVVAAFEFGGGQEQWDTEYETQVAFDGTYEILVPARTNRLFAVDFDGRLPQNYDRKYEFESDQATPVVSTSDVSGIDFYLEAPAYVRGQVVGDAAPLEGVRVEAFVIADENWSWRGWDETDASGNYELEVPGVTNLTVIADPNSSTSFWIRTTYSNVLDTGDATLVETQPGSPAENIDFDLFKGGRLEGTVSQEGAGAIEGAWVSAHTPDENDYDVHGESTESDGSYSMALTAGTYRVRAWADGWLTEYYNDHSTFERDSADIVTVNVETVTANIDFGLEEPSYISGNVHDGGTPLSGFEVQVHYVPDTNDVWQRDYMGSDETDGAGDYTVGVPAGSNYFVELNPNGYYLWQYWSNTTDAAAATLLTVGPSETVSGIDFDAEMGMRICGTVLDENSNPLEDAPVQAYTRDEDLLEYFVSQANTDDAGNYELALPAGTSYVVQVRYYEPENWYPGIYYDNTFFGALAQEVETNAGATVGGVDFQMTPGYRITGTIMDSDEVSPSPNSWFRAYDSGTNCGFYAPTATDGWYEILVTTNIALILEGIGGDRQGEYYDNVYAFGDATAIQSNAFVTARVDFVLYGSTEDSDGDGAYDWQEDTVPDGTYNPGQDYSDRATQDTDGDGQNDGEEWVAGTSPQNTNSLFQLTNAVVGGGGTVSLQWEGVAGRQYEIVATNVLKDATNAWEDVGVTNPSVSGPISYDIPTGTNEHQFYRIRVSNP
ncbi:MAG: carboxypeptidase regulatory-like domain-containing protein [Kiritimatiellae bacterium]|nr:carboxypeptidase regulatory-like domain-containing protein [Kiritimatiellia bacterium]